MKNNKLITIQLTPKQLVCVSIKKKSVSVYTVDLTNGTCNCPDFRYRGPLCKHLRAAFSKRPLPADRLEDFLPIK